MNCGTVWTYPYALDISKAVHAGKNTLQITVTNTWANRLAKDQILPVGKRITNTNAVIRLSVDQLNAAGLLGSVELIKVQ
ncbi:MAG: hypothetical protein KGO81_15115 [Bacteroidota bacterium]|nr:hypothetical protein [Bacteroidota bacterium]